MRALAGALAIVAVGWCVTIVAQPAVRRATTVAALKNYPSFYNQQTVLVIGEVRGEGERRSIGGDEASVRLIARDYPEGRVEARGQFLDIGRISQDDPRLIPFNLLDLVRTAYPDRWPRPGEELMLIARQHRPAAGRDRHRHAAAADAGDGAREVCRPPPSRSRDSSAAATCSAIFPKRRSTTSGSSCCDRPTRRCG